MTTARPRFPRYPVWPTIVIMTLLAVIGTLFWEVLTFAGNAAAVISSGPFAWIALGPALVASYGLAGVLTMVALPTWAAAVGPVFAGKASGDMGTAARDMSVALFSETHPISKVTQSMAAQMGLPKIAYIGWFPNEEINAFAMGNSQRNAMIALSKGAILRLSQQELIAIIGHELGHVASNDMARMTHARSVQEALTFFLVFRGLKKFARWVFTPLSELELLRLSRAREFTADEISATMIGPGPMISALERLREESQRPVNADYANVLAWSGFKGAGWLDTHPPLERRIARLKTLAQARAMATETPASAESPSAFTP